MPEPTDTRATVEVLLAAARLRLPAAEVDALVEMYAQLREAADSLRIEEAEGEPALLYSPVPPHAATTADGARS